MSGSINTADLPALLALIRNGRSAPLVYQYMDDLLRWLTGSEIQTSLAKELDRLEIDQTQLRSELLSLLDRNLFQTANTPLAVLGLRTDATQEVIKSRYFRLLKVFHPDHQKDNLTWWTERTERLNRAYTALKKGEVTTDVQAAVYTGVPTSVRAARFSTRYPSNSTGWLRHFLGRSQQFRYRFFVFCFLFSVGLLFYLYSLNAPSEAVDPYRGTVTRDPVPADAMKSVAGRVIRPPVDTEMQNQTLVPVADKPTGENAPESFDKPAQITTDKDVGQETKGPGADTIKRQPITPTNTVAETKPQLEVLQELAIPDQTITAGLPGSLHDAQLPVEISQQFFEQDTTFRVENSELIPMLTKESLAGILDSQSQARYAQPQDTGPKITSDPATTKTSSTKRLSSVENIKAVPDSGQLKKYVIEENIKKLLRQFSFWYQRGNAGGVVDLFLEDGIDGKHVGTTRIQIAYQRLFDKTSSRELSFLLDEIEPIDDDTFLITARYNLRLQYTNSDPKLKQDRLQARIRRAGDDYKFKQVTVLARSAKNEISPLGGHPVSAGEHSVRWKSPIPKIAAAPRGNATRWQTDKNHLENQAVEKLFDQFAYWYQLGDAHQVSDLFVDDAADGINIGKSRIRSAYQKIFGNTETRDLVFFIDQVKPIDEHTALLEVRYQLSLKYAKGRSKSREERVKAWIQGSGNDYKFKRIVYLK